MPLKPLHDQIRPGVRVLLVGINPGIRSAEIGHHFAGYSNRFWKLLHESGLVSERIGPDDDWRLPEWGLGITNLVARATPGIGDLAREEYEAGRARLLRKIRRFRPAIVALVGVTLCRALSARSRETSPGLVSARTSHAALRTSHVSCSLGLQPFTLADTPVFVLPNPSGRNAKFSYPEMLAAFHDLSRVSSGV